MKSYPLILSTSEVRAVLNGTKTQHRVMVKLQPPGVYSIVKWTQAGERWYPSPADGISGLPAVRCPFGETGDRLYVKEAHAWVDYLVGSELDDPVCVAFKADQTAYSFAGNKPVRLDTYAWPWDRIKWRSPALMPRWASRLTLAVESVRVQRVQDISEEDARADGVTPFPCDPDGDCWTDGTHRTAFNYAWNEKHGWWPNAWDRNDWVFALTFKRAEGCR